MESKIQTLVSDPSASVICYCAAGGKSILAVDTLRRMGYTNASALEGGFWAWKDRGLPIVKNLVSVNDRMERDA